MIGISEKREAVVIVFQNVLSGNIQNCKFKPYCRHQIVSQHVPQQRHPCSGSGKTQNYFWKTCGMLMLLPWIFVKLACYISQTEKAQVSDKQQFPSNLKGLKNKYAPFGPILLCMCSYVHIGTPAKKGAATWFLTKMTMKTSVGFSGSQAFISFHPPLCPLRWEQANQCTSSQSTLTAWQL